MATQHGVYDNVKLYVTPECFFIEPLNESTGITIDRSSEAISLQKNSVGGAAFCREICGVLGTIKLLAGRYLIIATRKECVGSIAGHLIWKLTGTEIISYCRSTFHLSPEQVTDNNIYLTMLEQVLNTPYYYFSYTYDLTHTIQRLHDAGPEILTEPLLQRADPRFVWNGHLLHDFQLPEFQKFCIPLMHGFIAINRLVVNNAHFMFTLISRRCVRRAGTRLFRRGVDHGGHVANFVETEQIVECQGDRASFVQIRGSIPLYWSQYPDLRYKPPPRLQDIGMDDQMGACARHLEANSLLYGRQVLLDLVDQRGAEGVLQTTYKYVTQSLNLSSVKYEPFDFHAECRHMRWDRLSILLDRIEVDQEEMGSFLLLRDGSLVSLQDGVFRTNCIDCLDRTNVVQSELAAKNLNHVLRRMSILAENETIKQHAALNRVFKEVWADNADLVSLQYSGTGALKTDFTRMGKRTRKGALQDGMNSLTRYYKNNFCDGFRQDALDLFHGNAQVRSPLYPQKSWRYVTYPCVWLVAVAMFVACTLLPNEYSTESLLSLMFWGTMVAATSITILHNGPEFVDRPRLVTI